MQHYHRFANATKDAAFQNSFYNQSCDSFPGFVSLTEYSRPTFAREIYLSQFLKNIKLYKVCIRLILMRNLSQFKVDSLIIVG